MLKNSFYYFNDQAPGKEKCIRTVSLMSSPACNLNCEYCAMANQKHGKNKQIIWDKTVEALKNGDYLKNTLKTLYKLEQSPHRVNRLELWGQEPTLTLPILSEHWKEWSEGFSGLCSVFFSTNGIGDPKNIIDFIKAVNEKSIHPMSIEIQFSYDGMYGEDKVRGGSSELVIKNLTTVLKAINALTPKLKNIFTIDVMLHTVLSTKLVEYLDDYEKVDSYFYHYEQVIKELQSLVESNKKINFYVPAFMYQNCYNASTEDGIKLNAFIDRVNKVKATKKYPNCFLHTGVEEDFAALMAGNGIADMIRFFRETHYWNSLDEYVNDYFINPQHPQRQLMETCSSGIGDLKVMYDGSMVICQNSVYDTMIDQQFLDNSVDNQARWHFMKHGQYINPSVDSDETIEKFYNYIGQLRTGSAFRFIYIQIYNLMIVLAQLGQINPEYAWDLQKTKRHAFIMARTTCCYYNMQVLSGSVLIRQAGEIRQMANGILDRLEKYVDTMMRIHGKEEWDDYDDKNSYRE